MEIELLKFLAPHYEMVDVCDFLIEKYGENPDAKSISEIQSKIRFLEEKKYIHTNKNHLSIRRQSTMRAETATLGQLKGFGKKMLMGITTDGRAYLESQKKPSIFNKSGLWGNVFAALAVLFTALTYLKESPTESKDRKQKDTLNLLKDLSQDSVLQIHQVLIDSLRRANPGTSKKD